jgi:hypothetical protein
MRLKGRDATSSARCAGHGPTASRKASTREA